jgi:GNAT superfamily N-acetyltransferase
VTEGGVVRVTARPATTDDLDPLTELATAARTSIEGVRGGSVRLSVDRGRGGDQGHLASAITSETQLLLVGLLDEVVVGYLLAALQATPGGMLLAEIEELYVEPDAREVGVGDALFALTLDWCVTQGCDGLDAVALPGDRATKNFFESHGLVARAIVAHRALQPDAGQPR